MYRSQSMLDFNILIRFRQVALQGDSVMTNLTFSLHHADFNNTGNLLTNNANL